MEAIHVAGDYSGPNIGLEIVYQNLIVAMFEQAITDCRWIIYGQNIYRTKDMSLNEKKAALERVFKELRRCHLLDYVTDNAEAYISVAEKEIFEEYDRYVEENY